MAIFALGPLVEGASPAQIEARQIRVAGLPADVAIPTGQFRVDVTAAVGTANPQTFVGRRFARSDGALIAASTEFDLRAWRNTIRGLLAAAEAQPVGAWQTAYSPFRARTYMRWLESIARAAADDDIVREGSNGLTAARAEANRAVILREASFDGATWYWEHYESPTDRPDDAGTLPTGAVDWERYTLPRTRDTWTPNFWASAETTAGPDTRGAVSASTINSQASITLKTDAAFDLTRWLREGD